MELVVGVMAEIDGEWWQLKIRREDSGICSEMDEEVRLRRSCLRKKTVNASLKRWERRRHGWRSVLLGSEKKGRRRLAHGRARAGSARQCSRTSRRSSMQSHSSWGQLQQPERGLPVGGAQAEEHEPWPGSEERPAVELDAADSFCRPSEEGGDKIFHFIRI